MFDYGHATSVGSHRLSSLSSLSYKTSGLHRELSWGGGGGGGSGSDVIEQVPYSLRD